MTISPSSINFIRQFHSRMGFSINNQKSTIKDASPPGVTSVTCTGTVGMI